MKRFALLSMLFLWVGCSEGDVATCVPGESRACACTAGSMGAQTCRDDGTFAACSCDGMNGAGDPDAGVAMDTGGASDGGDSMDMGGASGCYAPNQALALLTDGVATAQGLCTQQQVTDAVNCLLGNLQGTACDQLGLSDPFDTNAPGWSCSQCLTRFEGGPGPAAVINVGSAALILNTAACQAAATGAPECATPASQFVYCTETACENCLSSNAADACRAEAADDVCDQLRPIGACEAVLDADPLAAQCTGENFIEAFENIGQYFCGS